MSKIPNFSHDTSSSAACITRAVPLQYKFWDKEAAVKLVNERYAWFLPTFQGYSSVVAKGLS